MWFLICKQWHHLLLKGEEALTVLVYMEVSPRGGRYNIANIFFSQQYINFELKHILIIQDTVLDDWVAQLTLHSAHPWVDYFVGISNYCHFYIRLNRNVVCQAAITIELAL